MHRKKLFWWIATGCWAGLIFGLSSIPSLDSGLGRLDFYLRKTAHIFEYFVLTMLLLRSSTETWPHVSKWKLITYCMLAAVLYAASDEYHQSFVPGRGPSPVDVGIDFIGVALAALTAAAFKGKRQ